MNAARISLDIARLRFLTNELHQLVVPCLRNGHNARTWPVDDSYANCLVVSEVNNHRYVLV